MFLENFMDVALIESAGFWLAVTFYAAGFLLACAAVAFKSEKAGRGVNAAVRSAWVLQSAVILYRGLAQVSPPFITYFESVLFGCWLGAGFYLLARRLPPAAGGIVCGINFILMGSAALAPSPHLSLPPGLQSWWLVLHVLTALAVFGVLVAGTGAAVSMLLPAGSPGAGKGTELLLVKCLSFAFLAQLGMVASGSVWAQKAWGRYWGWDPIETFSLATWIFYGIALHMRYFFGWGGRKLAWFTVAGLALCVYGIWGVPYFSHSVHLYEIQ